MITKDITIAKAALTNLKLAAIPTETVYGLVAASFTEIAVNKIFKLKKRPHFNPLIIHIQSAVYLDNIAINIPPIARILAAHFWPGPLILVLNKRKDIPDIVTAGKSTVAVRVPNHPLALNLLKQLNFPLAAPSANPFG